MWFLRLRAAIVRWVLSVLTRLTAWLNTMNREEREDKTTSSGASYSSRRSSTYSSGDEYTSGDDDVAEDKPKVITLTPIGKGHFGIVYQTETEVVKSIELEPMGKPDQINDALTEAAVLARCNHPNIAKYFGMALHIRMEYIAGTNLYDYRFYNGAIEWQIALPLAQQMAAAVAYLHNQRIIHRDLKPENVMLTLSETPANITLIDFGLAYVLKHGQTHTNDNRSVGSPPFMAPEVFTNKNTELKSDVYSLAIVLWEMLAGMHVFDDIKWSNATQFLTTIHKSKPVKRPDTTTLGIPDPMRNLMHNLMHRMWAADPADRPSSAEIVKELDAMPAQHLQK